MLKILLRLFGSGQLPREGRSVIEAEHCQIVSERLQGSITLRNFRGPGRYAKWKRQWFMGSLAVSDKRVLIYRYNSCLIDVSFDDKRFAEIDFSTETPGVLSIAYDAGLFQPRWSGDIELALRTQEALHVCSVISKHSLKGHKRGTDAHLPVS